MNLLAVKTRCMDAKGWKVSEVMRIFSTCTTHIHVPLGLNHFTHPLVQTWPPCRAHTIFGQRAVEVIRRCEFECDRGFGVSASRTLQVLFAQGERRAKPAGRAGLAAVDAPPRPCRGMARRREIPQIHRRPGKHDCELLTAAAPQKPSLSRLRLCEAVPTGPAAQTQVNTCQSQQARLQ